ncbi:MAG: DUF2341 domain-containing protein, partial [Fibrobacteria bacterium]|nr:DUF2341 domain-containing protein [Fibrobacteria bacterium]
MNRLKTKYIAGSFLLNAALWLLVLVSLPNATDYSTWSYNRNIYMNTTASGANVSGDESNFPVLVRLNSGNFDFSEPLTVGGADIRFTKSDGTTDLAYEIERWDDGVDSAEIWVLIPVVWGNNKNQNFRMHWGKVSQTTTESSANVFHTSNNFQGVWHLDEEVAGTSNADAYKDATSNGYDLDDEVSSTGQNGAIGKGQQFDGSDDGLLGGNVLGFERTNSFTLSAWANVSSDGAIISKEAVGGGSPGYDMLLASSKLALTMINNYGTGNWLYEYSTAVVAAASWKHYAITYTGNSNVSGTTYYVNGEAVATTTNTNALSASILNATTFSLGNRNNSMEYLTGYIDEARVENVNRSADWMRLCYQNQQSSQTLITFETEDYPTDWDDSCRVYINTTSTGADVSSNQVDFPLLIRLDSLNFNFGTIYAGGTSIRFSKSDGTHLYYEIARWDDTNELAEVWVRVDTVYGDNSSQYIVMWWDNADKGDFSNPEEVFHSDNGFDGAWHLEEDGNTSAGGYIDATYNSQDGQGTGLNASSDMEGMVGRSQDLDGSTSWINNGTINLSGDSLSISAWINVDVFQAASPYISTIAGEESGTNLALFRLGDAALDKDKLQFVLYIGAGETKLDGTTALSANTWYYVTATYDGINMRIYINGSEDVNKAQAGSFTANAGFEISRSSAARYLDGTIDEVHVSTVTHSADWIKLEYQNQRFDQQMVSFNDEDYAANWDDSCKVFLNTMYSGADVSGDVANFPLLIRLNKSNFDFGDIYANGTSIRFSTSDGFKLFYEIERWDDTEEMGEIWVRIDTVYGDNSSQYIVMWWDNADMGDRSNPEEVFHIANGFRGVWHMDNNTTSQITGSTVYGHVGTKGSVDNPAEVDGIVGKSQDFSTDYITAPNNTALDFSNTEPITINAWVKHNNVSATGGTIITDRVGSNGNYALRKATGTGQIEFYYWDGGAWEVWKTTSAVLTSGNWFHVSVTYTYGTGGSIVMYVNGISAPGSWTVGAGNDAPVVTSGTIKIGHQGVTPIEYWDGKLDEIGVSKAIRSADWIKLEYQSQRWDQQMVTWNDEDYSSWAHNRDITINTTSSGANVTGNVANFPMLVRLTADNFDFSEAQPSGQDVRFDKSDGTVLPFEIERWDNINKLAEIWVLIDTVYGSNASQYFTMYWGKPGVSGRSNPQLVFHTANGF